MPKPYSLEVRGLGGFCLLVLLECLRSAWLGRLSPRGSAPRGSAGIVEGRAGMNVVRNLMASLERTTRVEPGDAIVPYGAAGKTEAKETKARRRQAKQKTVEELVAEVGQRVEKNEVVAVVETDKVSLDIRASRGGVIEEALVSVGEEVKEQQPLFLLLEED